MMFNYFIHDAAGNITSSGTCQEEVLPLMESPGHTVRSGVANPATQYFDIAGDTLCTYDDAALARRASHPGFGFRWSLGRWIDERDLATAKSQKWAEIKRCRTGAEESNFTWNGYTFQCDEKSQMRLTIAAQDMAGNGPNSVDWTLADNSVVSLSKADIKNVIKAMRGHIQAQVDKAEAMRALIDAATTKEELNSLTW